MLLESRTARAPDYPPIKFRCSPKSPNHCSLSPIVARNHLLLFPLILWSPTYISDSRANEIILPKTAWSNSKMNRTSKEQFRFFIRQISPFSTIVFPNPLKIPTWSVWFIYVAGGLSRVGRYNFSVPMWICKVSIADNFSTNRQIIRNV